MALDPKARELLDARAKVLPPTGTVPAHEMRALHRALLAKQPPGPDTHQVEDQTCAGPGGDIPMRLYRPSPSPRALIVYFHGGGWTGGSRESVALRALPYLEMGMAVVNVSYRLGRTLNFDPEKQEVTGDHEANVLLRDGDRGYRKGFQVPEKV